MTTTVTLTCAGHIETYMGVFSTMEIAISLYDPFQPDNHPLLWETDDDN